MKDRIIIFAFLIIASIVITKVSNILTNGYDIKTYKVENGWGYKIHKKNKVIIKQDIIPGIAVKKPFATEKDALIVGELMIEKLKNKKIPSISYKELQINGVIL